MPIFIYKQRNGFDHDSNLAHISTFRSNSKTLGINEISHHLTCCDVHGIKPENGTASFSPDAHVSVLSFATPEGSEVCYSLDDLHCRECFNWPVRINRTDFSLSFPVSDFEFILGGTGLVCYLTWLR